MFDTLSYEDLKKIENTNFTVLDSTENVALELVEVSEKKTTTRQESFSLWLRTSFDFFLPQNNYRLHHSELGDGELFIVPIEKDEKGFLYQAVFNRLI
jgi:hypothetical protein